MRHRTIGILDTASLEAAADRELASSLDVSLDDDEGRHSPADTGCTFASSCLACPLPFCRYEQGPKGANVLTVLRTSQLLALLRGGMPVAFAGAQLGMSKRNAYRIAATARAS